MFYVDLLPRGQKARHTHLSQSVASVHRPHFNPHNMWVEMSAHKKTLRSRAFVSQSASEALWAVPLFHWAAAHWTPPQTHSKRRR